MRELAVTTILTCESVWCRYLRSITRDILIITGLFFWFVLILEALIYLKGR